jgi:hypothetical protein
MPAKRLPTFTLETPGPGTSARFAALQSPQRVAELRHLGTVQMDDHGIERTGLGGDEKRH